MDLSQAAENRPRRGLPPTVRSLNRVGPVILGPISLMKTDACLGVSEDSPGHLGSVAGRASSPTT